MIPADHIAFNDDGTTWLVFGDDDNERMFLPAEWADDLDRPCDTCGGNWQDYLEPLDRDGNVVSPCPDCHGTGRHTFDIEVADERRPWPEHHKTYRVSIVPGMVLPIVDRRMQPTTPTGPVILLGFNGPSIWTESTGHQPINLPPAAAPGMWAVLLKKVA